MSFKINHFSLLKSIPRKKHRKVIELNLVHLPFIGQDIWTLYELSWLNKNGLPQVSVAKIEINATSVNIIESKSFKIYINSFNQVKFDNYINFIKILQADLTKCAGGEVSIKLFNLDEIQNQKISNFSGYCIDNQNIKIKHYEYNRLLLVNSSKKEIVQESIYSNLFKSNCPITHQPDWASIQIIYTGQAINHNALLSYLISFRNCNEFHEECIERIFNDLETVCKPEKLSVYARYTRRGGIDINPWRSNAVYSPCLIRMARQ
ncbi:NADPH-dependent 7-cyano-7-deazaguanine reductase QueF [Buchnera aphidicola]|uniref:NADPH-dependent 7-cyano-7-deazaguanine reductase n=1 Tax=Buchnera aphidicola str. USDA (Myzus persicae) TaxID=1009856 RepID=W0P0R5_BUCMP|nr:NADPH-dependent 7-cyano-7-deazaguanine reductase QueF [Buchnera aphidicola]AHG60366.1 Quef [Buchnera aphidicola str. USDA (Myzus persicae)]AHG60944.1 Quef [Buchnera aphidicola str. W106 (Myzus persicae)]AHG61516.1 Quef [Buchnera aphidicola str. G002 (Myzus persicae)]AHG62089.1 Quef [Buchnera aphidicola str. F009 (Myzus persicae)]WAI03228.1 MAG: NADPH-dependent 7-cyano-7-deazaguanine reductase QueF [Buchnera aphidicola (Myzus persicae)]